MNCRRCGNALPANAAGCPRCDGGERPPAKTKRLTESDLNKTRALVQIERCQNCGFMVFPADTECASCGTWIDRAWQTPAASKSKKAAPAPAKARVLFGIGISFLVFCLSFIVWQFLIKPPLH